MVCSFASIAGVHGLQEKRARRSPLNDLIIELVYGYRAPQVGGYCH